MLPKLIFDVDYTLYNSKDIPIEENETEDITEKFYSLFKPKHKLIELLKSYKGEIYVFSNGNLCHVQEVLDKTELSNLFDKDRMATLDNYLDKPKPYVKAYKYVIQKFSIKDSDVVYFFEDNLDNLKIAKQKYNWNSIFIDEKKTTNKKKSHYKYIDYTFKDIEQSLSFLIPKLHNKYDKYNNDNEINLKSKQTPTLKRKIKSRKKRKKKKLLRSPIKHRRKKGLIKTNRLERLNRLEENKLLDNTG